jgi:hypothetical protein
MGIKKVLIVGHCSSAQLLTGMLSSLDKNVQIVNAEELEKQKIDREAMELKNYRLPEQEFEPKVDLHKLHELHPFAKFMNNKKKRW